MPKCQKLRFGGDNYKFGRARNLVKTLKLKSKILKSYHLEKKKHQKL